MHATVKRWGNAYALRLTKADLARFGLHVGSLVEVALQPVRAPVDLAALPTFRDDAPVDEARRQLYGQRRRWES
jgi:antitoxin component of MazEF toxin-antitoxin module